MFIFREITYTLYSIHFKLTNCYRKGKQRSQTPVGITGYFPSHNSRTLDLPGTVSTALLTTNYKPTSNSLPDKLRYNSALAKDNPCLLRKDLGTAHQTPTLAKESAARPS